MKAHASSLAFGAHSVGFQHLIQDLIEASPANECLRRRLPAARSYDLVTTEVFYLVNCSLSKPLTFLLVWEKRRDQTRLQMATHLKTNKNLPCPYLYPARKGMAFHSWLTSANRDLSQCLSTSLYRILSCTLQVRLHLSLPQEQLRRKLTWKHTYKNQHIRKETAELTRELFTVLFLGKISDWSRITRNMVYQRNRRILTPDWILRFLDATWSEWS